MSRQQRIVGSIYGACRPQEHFPPFARWALDAKLLVSPLISRTMHALEEINEAFETMRQGALLRVVLVFSDEC